MFDFEKLKVYQKAKRFHQDISFGLNAIKSDKITLNQFRRAALSIMLNISEGTGRFTNRDKRRFFVIARGSVFECAAILDSIYDREQVSRDDFRRYYQELEEISKMLLSLIKMLE